MNYSESDLEKISEYAGLLLNIPEIAVLLDFDEDELRDAISLKTHGISIAYRKSKTQTILEMRQEEIQLAKLGSPGAMDIIQKYIIDQKIQENN